MKLYLRASEEYPVYSLTEAPPHRLPWTKPNEVELTDAEWADYQRVTAEFQAWQDRLHATDTK